MPDSSVEDPAQLAALDVLANGIIPADEIDRGASEVNAAARLAEKARSGANTALYRQGIAEAATIAEERFGSELSQLSPEQVHELLAIVQNRLPAFFKQLRLDVSAIYLSDRTVWKRIGFPGPSTESGGYPDFDQPQRTPFDELEAEFASRGAEAALERLAGQFHASGDYHALFDARLMLARQRLSLPIILTMPLDDLAEPMRGHVEAAYLEACREIGWLFWNSGRFREAWMYLRPLGENSPVAAALNQIEPNDENLQALIEIALQEGVSPARGFELVLRHYGTCNAITTFDSEMGRHRRSEQQAAAAMLVRQLHSDLAANIRSDIVRREGAGPETASIPELLAGRDWLFADNSYHTDTSHLSAAVRIARIVEDPAVLALAWELTEYGRRLAPTLQFRGDPPFEDIYPSHALFFSAQIGRNIGEAVSFFRGQADKANPDEEGTAAAEVYVVLLIRLHRLAEALEEHIRLMPTGVRTTGFAPTVVELARLAGDYPRLMAVSRQRGDLLGFTAGMLSNATPR
ncbi:MAG TPA: gluconate 2-dehydrogenase subunit 3 family protein [Pirellulales bacterium]|nr:gluconate 2-dehydrogenase subunit 3 family protein [Pirellulales bacterium]